MPNIRSGSIPHVVDQHVEEASGLYQRRMRTTHSPDATLETMRRSDDRLAAHLDGIAVAGVHGRSCLETALAEGSAGATFTAAVYAIQGGDHDFLNDLLVRVQTGVSDARELIAAFGWVSAERLQGLGVALLSSSEPFRQWVGITACAMHRVDPGIISAQRFRGSTTEVRARAVRMAGEIGCLDAVPACAGVMRDDDAGCGFWAAWSSVLLGNRGTALDSVAASSLVDGPHRLRAFRLSLQAMSASAAHRMLQNLAKDPAQVCWLIQGSGIAGDSGYLPWLVKHMADPKTARLSGEAFSLITGVDFGQTGLEGAQPQGFEFGPNDDPDDPNVDMDPDDGLPWPDVEKIQKWCAENGSRFQKGTRYFMGAPVTRAHCVDVLKNGYQRQRILAAHYLCLLEPGTPLFSTSAPAWRQQRLLAKMT